MPPVLALPPPAPATAVPVPSTSCPTSWFRDPLDTAIKSAVRPATALTRRKELTVSFQLPPA
eukprot:2476951-Prymnesium_polylepis.1